MNVTCKQLAPGVTLRVVETDKFKSAVFGVTLLAPLTRETAAANALVPMVLRRGTAQLRDMQAISAALDELYGGVIEPAIRRKGETQCVGFTARFLDDTCTLDGAPILERAANLLRHLLLDPVTGAGGGFLPEYVDGERANLIDRIRAQKNDKNSYAVSRLTELMCKDEAYGVGRLGDEEQAAQITAETLWARYEALLAESELLIFYCGSAPCSRVEAAFAQLVRALPRAAKLVRPGCQVREKPNDPSPRVFTEPMDVTQGKLSLGFRTGGVGNLAALRVFNAAYGASTNSRLFIHVRERLSLCYYAQSMIEPLKGVLLVASGVDFSKFDAARDEILAQMEACRRGELDEDELHAARAYVASDLRETLDTQGRLEEYWLTNAAAGVETTPEELAQQVLAVSAQQVAAVAGGMTLDSIYYLTGKGR